MKQLIGINELTERLLPLTYFRRNAGQVIKKLDKVGSVILTKDGKPIAELISLKKQGKKEEKDKAVEENLKKLYKFAGGYDFGPISPRKIKKIIMKHYEKVLPGR